MSLHELITAMAFYFEQDVLGRVFKADPVASFTVDERTPDEIRPLIVAALNIGAIVIVDDENVNFTATSPVGRTFRLVHLLAPYFNLPMRKGRSRNLSTILSKRTLLSKRVHFAQRESSGETNNDQLGLFS